MLTRSMPAAGAVPLTGRGDASNSLSPAAVAETLVTGLERLALENQRVLVIVPDATRSVPLDTVFAVVHDTLARRVRTLDVLVALGTHPPMTRQAIERMFGVPAGSWNDRFPGVSVHNHRWDDVESLALLGTIDGDEIAIVSGGLLSESMPIRVNRLVTECDVCLVVGPVFPHEVVGFSGGNKYFFPGVSGPEVIDNTHWLGALITTENLIGTLGTTPVRALIDRAAERIPAHRLCVSLVVAPEGLAIHGVYVGAPDAAWRAAADLSSQVHVRYVDEPFQRVVSVMPPMYDDLWVAAKGMYKVEPVVADGGEAVIYAPHVTTFSRTHDHDIRGIGYHCRDYFLTRLNEFAGVPRGVLAHSTHLRGAGAYDTATQTERCRIEVVLATAISERECRAVNLAWRDWREIDLVSMAGEPGTLVVPRAGELLFRLNSPAAP